MHPPTAYCFSKHFLFTLSFASIPLDVRHDILELARFLTELSVIDYYFVIHRPSSVAMAALMCAFEWVPGLSPLVSNDFLLSVRKFGLDPLGEHVSECRNRLKLLYAQGGYSRPALVSDDRNETISPVCVSYGCTPSVEPKNTSDADYNYSTTQASASN